LCEPDHGIHSFEGLFARTQRNEVFKKLNHLMMNPRPAARSMKIAASSQNKIKFATTIRTMVAELEQAQGTVYSIPTLSKRHQIKRRRFYDVTNIFTTIGCATRSGTDELTWHGISKILPRLLEEKQKSNITNYQLSLAALFLQDNCVGLSSLTTSLLMIFPAIGRDVLNLRDVSAFFSRDTQRYKTTLCKLYQITLILGALEITERTENACEVRIKAPFTRILADEEEENPLAIERLLNRPNSNDAALEERRAEFHKVCVGYTGTSK
jgi:hypothetical protein